MQLPAASRVSLGMRLRAVGVAMALVSMLGEVPAFAGAPPRYALAASQAAEAVPIDSYALDSLSRDVPAKGTFSCPEIDLVAYAGTTIKLHKSVRMQRVFIERMQRFEHVVVDVATKIYGRPPRRLRHLGSFVCRRMRRFPTWLSEHALGNAIDIAAFDFGAASTAQRAAAPRGLRGSFRVVVDDHWSATKGVGAIHARFLHALADALIARPDIFRVMLGPSYPGHLDHLHLDASFFRSIEF